VAELEGNPESVEPAPESVAESAPAMVEEEPVIDPLAALAQPQRELLDAALDALRELDPEPGVLDGLPQVSVDKKYTLQACRLIKDDPRLSAKMLLCLACVDYSEYFELVYMLHSLEPEQTLVLRTNVPYDDAVAPSVTSVWRAADWYEREAHDLFGVDFEGHPDLAPLLLYDGFEGFPGRKEFPFNEYQEF